MELEELDELYQHSILDHYNNPRNRRILLEHDMHTEGNNPFCGDEVVFEAKLDASGRLQEVAFHGHGCVISQSSASMMVESLQGKDLNEVDAITAAFKRMMYGKELTDVEQAVLGGLAALGGVKKYPIRIKCALLPWTTLQEGVDTHRGNS